MLSLFSHVCFVLQPVSQLEYLTKICVTNEIHEITHLFNVTHVYIDVLSSCKLWTPNFGWIDAGRWTVGQSRWGTKQNLQQIDACPANPSLIFQFGENTKKLDLTPLPGTYYNKSRARSATKVLASAQDC
jgi:hypothetical protein